jgi:hypothetical protein
MKTQIWLITVALVFFSLPTFLYAEPLTIFGVGYDSPLFAPNPQLQSELYQFSEDGQMATRWNLPQSRAGGSIATSGNILYVAEYGGAIERYDLAGGFVGQFANVSGQAGITPTGQYLETDLNGHFYSAFDGFQSNPRTSFQIDQAGNVLQTFSHPDLVFPSGIDANANGDVYIVNSGGTTGERLFRFTSGGAYISDYAIPQAVNSQDIAIDETRGTLYIADEFGSSVLKYDLSSGAPVFTTSLPVPGSAIDVFVEPISGRIFGALYTRETDSTVLPFLKFVGFELTGNSVTLFTENAIPTRQTVMGIVALAIPEPSSGALIAMSSSILLLRRRRSASASALC